jgi:hypothetical protein
MGMTGFVIFADEDWRVFTFANVESSEGTVGMVADIKLHLFYIIIEGLWREG